MNQNKILLISSGDSNYFPMIREWLHSITRFEQSKNVDIAILDVGLTKEQCDILHAEGVTHITEPDWPCKIPAHRIRGRNYLRACVARPFIPDYFPDYETYLWMDGDTWLQDWEAIDLFVEGARRKGFSIVPQVDRSFGKTMRLKWLGPLPWKPRSFYYSNAKKAFSGKIARQLFPYATVNAGVFAMTGDTKHWQRWQDLILQALKKGRVFTAEQLTLGYMIYLDKCEVELLPAWCNWLLEVKPGWDTEENCFTEPTLPNRKIGVMHLCGCDEMRADRSLTETLTIPVTGEKIEKSYRYPDFDGETSV